LPGAHDGGISGNGLVLDPRARGMARFTYIRESVLRIKAPRVLPFPKKAGTSEFQQKPANPIALLQMDRFDTASVDFHRHGPLQKVHGNDQFLLSLFDFQEESLAAL
jgi:hypothetical protein